MDGDTVASPAVAWSPNELQSIARTDDLHISPLREDGKTYGTPTWIWSVVVDGDLYVRAYTAVIASVVKRANGTFGVEDVWVSFDAGTIVNSDRVRAQLEGAVIFGMSLALYGGITMKGGAIEQDNFRGGGRIVRINEAPRRISVDLVESTAAPGGVGEPGVPPVAPAIANALFALTGQRIRELPLSKSIPV